MMRLEHLNKWGIRLLYFGLLSGECPQKGHVHGKGMFAGGKVHLTLRRFQLVAIHRGNGEFTSVSLA
jgi:hypothetical protein